jgi:hypothetical protein
VSEQALPKKRKMSYISTGLSNLESDFPLLQDMRALIDNNPTMTATELLDEVEHLIEADKQRRMKREAARHAQEED